MARVPCNKLLTNLASSSCTGEYWPLVIFVRTLLRSGSVLPQPRANIPQYGPRTRLVRGYYYMAKQIRAFWLDLSWSGFRHNFASNDSPEIGFTFQSLNKTLVCHQWHESYWSEASYGKVLYNITVMLYKVPQTRESADETPVCGKRSSSFNLPFEPLNRPSDRVRGKNENCALFWRRIVRDN